MTLSMKNYSRFFFLFLMLFPIMGVAQNDKVKKGNDKFNEFAYIDARTLYLKVVEKGYQSQQIYEQIGDSYYFNGSLKESAKWYGLLLNTYKDSVDPEYYFRYAQSLKSLGQYDTADIYMEQFLKLVPSDKRGQKFSGEKNYLALIEAQSGRFELTPTDINSEMVDFAPTYYLGDLVFASSRSQKGFSKRIHEWNNQPFLDLYKARTKNDSLLTIEPFSEVINTKYHESTAVFTSDGNTMYFTRNNFTNKDLQENSEGISLLKLYVSHKEDGKWSTPQELPFNSNNYSVAHPTLHPNEKYLYFVSDMPGGKGQSDLYKVEITEEGYGTPENLEMLNTEGKETFPFIAFDGTLYFSSDGYQGLGGLDVFVALPDEMNTFSEAYNIGEPVNSTSDDFSFVLQPHTTNGYVASNRDGGKGSDDIYAIQQIRKPIATCIQDLEGIVVNKKTSVPISGAKLQLFNADNVVISETISNSSGYYIFKEVLCSSQFAVRASKETYQNDEAIVLTNGVPFQKQSSTLQLTPNVPIEVGTDLNAILSLAPIYFDLDAWNIRPDAAVELEKVIAFLQEYPDIKIDVRSHTDSRNSNAYNLTLSQKRNVATLQYIMENGNIEPSRLTGKGYGESQLLNACVDGIECSEELHQLNRRSEFIIIN